LTKDPNEYDDDHLKRGSIFETNNIETDSDMRTSSESESESGESEKKEEEKNKPPKLPLQKLKQPKTGINGTNSPGTSKWAAIKERIKMEQGRLTPVMSRRNTSFFPKTRRPSLKRKMNNYMGIICGMLQEMNDSKSTSDKLAKSQQASPVLRLSPESAKERNSAHYSSPNMPNYTLRPNSANEEYRHYNKRHGSSSQEDPNMIPHQNGISNINGNGSGSSPLSFDFYRSPKVPNTPLSTFGRSTPNKKLKLFLNQQEDADLNHPLTRVDSYRNRTDSFSESVLVVNDNYSVSLKDSNKNEFFPSFPVRPSRNPSNISQNSNPKHKVYVKESTATFIPELYVNDRKTEPSPIPPTNDQIRKNLIAFHQFSDQINHYPT
jgi:hypothetical protein